MSLLDAGREPSNVNLARELGISRQAAWAMFRRHPDLRLWINQHVQAAADQCLGGILYRCGLLALRGSEKHIEMMLRFYQAGGYGKAGSTYGDVEPGTLPGAVSTVINLLVPRPEMPVIERSKTIDSLATAVPWPKKGDLPTRIPTSVPTVEVR
jgi:hypothetical protein